MQPARALRTHRFHFEDWVPVALKSRGRIGKSAVNFTHMKFHRPATHRACFASHARPPTATVDSRNIEHATFDQSKTAGNTIKLAVLIDAENAQPTMSGLLFAEVAKYGTACVKRAYGNWTGTSLTGWKDQLLKQAIQPIQQFAYTQGKNATDMAMIIDAMDLLYSNRFDGFCLVSSDSDFTRLAVRIRESGLPVYGFGNRTTPKPFVVACNRFVYIENLTINDAPGTQADETASPQKRAAAGVTDDKVISQLENAIEAASEEDGWAPLADVGSLITKRHPDFDPRTYGYGKLRTLLAATPLFEVTRRSRGEDKSEVVVYVRSKRKAHEHASK